MGRTSPKTLYVKRSLTKDKPGRRCLEFKSMAHKNKFISLMANKALLYNEEFMNSVADLSKAVETNVCLPPEDYCEELYPEVSEEAEVAPIQAAAERFFKDTSPVATRRSGRFSTRKREAELVGSREVVQKRSRGVPRINLVEIQNISKDTGHPEVVNMAGTTAGGRGRPRKIHTYIRGANQSEGDHTSTTNLAVEFKAVKRQRKATFKRFIRVKVHGKDGKCSLCQRSLKSNSMWYHIKKTLIHAMDRQNGIIVDTPKSYFKKLSAEIKFI